MKIKRWLSITAVTALAAVGTMGGLAAAHGGGEEIGSRVAEILDLDQETVIEAFDQARTDIQGQQLQAKLDQAVEDERISEEQAEEFQSWFDQRPEGLSILHSGKVGFWRGSGNVASIVADTLELGEDSLTDAIREARCELIVERSQQWLDQAVEDGRITQEQADKITERLYNCDETGWPSRFGKGRMSSDGGHPKMFIGGHEKMCDKMTDAGEEAISN